MLESDVFWKAIGWTGNALFFGRFLIQWIATERAQRITVPPVFWYLSVAGALASGAYAVRESFLIFAAAPAVNLFIYLRNLAILSKGRGLGGGSMWALGAGLFALLALGFAMDEHKSGGSAFWTTIGVCGAALWLARFLLQWLHAERSGEASFPLSFFVTSALGSSLLLAFAIHVGDEVLIAGNALGPIMYGRQLAIAWRTRQRQAANTSPVFETPRSPVLEKP